MQNVRDLVPEYGEADDEDDREEHDAHQVVDEIVVTASVLPIHAWRTRNPTVMGLPQTGERATERAGGRYAP